MTKLQNSSSSKTQLVTQLVKKIYISNSYKTQIVKILLNSNCDKIYKLKL